MEVIEWGLRSSDGIFGLGIEKPVELRGLWGRNQSGGP